MDETLKKRLLNLGYTVIGSTYSKDNKFANIWLDKFKGYHLSGVNKPNKDTGTGCIYKIGYEFSNHDIEMALNYCFNGYNPPFYEDINDYLVNHYDAFNLIIETPYTKKTPFELLDGYYIFISDKYKRIISKSHKKAMKYFNNTNYFNNHKAIFQITKGELEIVNHNINLFNDCLIMEDFKNKIKRG